MIPSKAAQEIAATNYLRLPLAQRSGAKLAGRIAAGAELTDDEVGQLAGFFSTADASPEYAIAVGLVGGAPMARQIQASGLKKATTTATSPPARQAMASAGVELPLITEMVQAVDEQLERLDLQAAGEIRGAVQMGFRSALDRVGRMAKRNNPGESRPAVVVAAASGAEMFEGLNVENLIRPAIEDACAMVDRIIGQWQLQLLQVVGDAWRVDFDSETLDEISTARADACTLLEQRLTTEVTYRIETGAAAEHVDEGNDRILQAPPGLLADVGAVAGGAELVTDEFGNLRPKRDSAALAVREAFAGGNGVMIGPNVELLTAQAVAALREAESDPEPVTAAARRRAGALISDALRDELAVAAGSDSVSPVVVFDRTWLWRRNYHGVSQTVFAAHDLDGDTFTESEFNEPGAPRPRDHNYCNCEAIPKRVAVTG